MTANPFSSAASNAATLPLRIARISGENSGRRGEAGGKSLSVGSVVGEVMKRAGTRYDRIKFRFFVAAAAVSGEMEEKRRDFPSGIRGREWKAVVR